MSKKHKILNFIIQKLKNKHIFLKKYTDWAILGHVTQNLEFWFQCRKCAPWISLIGWHHKTSTVHAVCALHWTCAAVVALLIDCKPTIRYVRQLVHRFFLKIEWYEGIQCCRDNSAVACYVVYEKIMFRVQQAGRSLVVVATVRGAVRRRGWVTCSSVYGFSIAQILSFQVHVQR